MASRTSTSQDKTSDKQEIATNTSNLHLTSRVRVELESSLQGHLKALSKLTRGIETANHHTRPTTSSHRFQETPKRIDTKGNTKNSRHPRNIYN